MRNVFKVGQRKEWRDLVKVYHKKYAKKRWD